VRRLQLTGYWQQAYLHRFVIRNRRLIAPQWKILWQNQRVLKWVILLRTLLRFTPLPDCDLLISVSDLFEEKEFLKCLEVPLFTISKTCEGRGLVLWPDIVSLRYFAYVQHISSLFPRWEQRQELLFWRGSTSGFQVRYDNFVRQKVVELSQKHPQEIDAAFSRLVQTENLPRAFDIKAEVEPMQQAHYKYLLALDGNSFATSLYWQLASGSLVFKNDSPCFEWYHDGLVPFVHYIPFAHNVSDLLEKKRWAQAHDAEVRCMAEKARIFAAEFLTPASVLAFVYHSLIHYTNVIQKSACRL
jgi:hypothetical protein